MQRRTNLIQQERDALDAYETLIRTMREVAQRESDSVRPLGQTFEAALGRLSDATTRIVNIHTALVGAVSDGAGAAVDDSALRKLDERRTELLRQATELTELLQARRELLRGELDKVRVPRKPRSVYGGENSASIIDVSG